MEKVWDYPRPPALVRCERRVRVQLGGQLLAESVLALRVLETSHPPTVYIPPADLRSDLLREGELRPTWCVRRLDDRGSDRSVQGPAGHARMVSRTPRRTAGRTRG
jgi:hypothetical protein